MNHPFQKDLDPAAKDRDEAQVTAYRERIEANRKAQRKFASADAGAAVSSITRPIGTTVGEAVNTTKEDAYWQRAFITEPYYNRNYSYDDYGPAYRMGYLTRRTYGDRSWDELETALKSVWESTKGTSRLTWEEARDAGLSAWHHAGSQRV